MTRAALLAAYLRDCARTPFARGSSDCTFMVADWVWLVRGVDPVPDWRDSYSTAAEADAILARTGTSAPSDGAVGVVVVGEVPRCAIRTSRGWALRSPTGLIVTRHPLRVLAAWAV
jgi:hypothetical protein